MVKTRFFDENLNSSTTTLNGDSKITCARFISEHHMKGIHFLLTLSNVCLYIKFYVKIIILECLSKWFNFYSEKSNKSLSTSNDKHLRIWDLRNNRLIYKQQVDTVLKILIFIVFTDFGWTQQVYTPRLGFRRCRPGLVYYLFT